MVSTHTGWVASWVSVAEHGAAIGAREQSLNYLGICTFVTAAQQGLICGSRYEPNHRIEVSDCYVESHWQSNGFINGGGECGTGNCSIANYW